MDLINPRQHHLRKVINKQILPSLATRIEQAKGGVFSVHERGKPIKYMFKDETVHQIFREVGKFFIDLTKIPDSIILPESPEELSSLVYQIYEAKLKGVPVPLYTPICPDWSKDDQGRYDFKSLGDGESEIALKFFEYSKPLLKLFTHFGIPYEGYLLFADFGLETEIVVNDSYGIQMSQVDIEKCFQSSLKATQDGLEELKHEMNGSLFKEYKVIPMTVFFRNRGFQTNEIYLQMANLFLTESKGIRLVEQINKDGFDLNKQRFGLMDEEENRRLARKNLSEYATLGQSIGERGFIIACESKLSSRAYNLFRKNALPLFYIRGKRQEGENIL